MSGARWEVRVYGWNWLAASCGLPATPNQLRAATYRWRWLASLSCYLWNISPSIAGIKVWATLHRAPPKLRAVESCPPALPRTRGLGKGIGSVGVGRAPVAEDVQ